jgi:hypothetical protein
MILSRLFVVNIISPNTTDYNSRTSSQNITAYEQSQWMVLNAISQNITDYNSRITKPIRGSDYDSIAIVCIEYCKSKYN